MLSTLAGSDSLDVAAGRDEGGFVGRLSWSWPVTGKAFARASLPPKLLAILAFSFVAAGVGVFSYAQALPGLAAGSPFMQQLVEEKAGSNAYLPGVIHGQAGDGSEKGETGNSLPDSSILEAEKGKAGSSDSASVSLPDASSASGGGESAAGSVGALSVPSGTPGFGGPGAGGSGGNGTSPAAGGYSDSGASSASDSSDSGPTDQSPGSYGSPAGGSSSNSGSSSSSSVPDPVPEPVPEPEVPRTPEEGGPVPEAMEAEIHQVLVNGAAKMQSWADEAWARIKQYESLSMTLDYDSRHTAWLECQSEIGPIHDTIIEIGDDMRAACKSSDGMQVWQQSRWYDSYCKMTEACSRLEMLMSRLAQAWQRNVWHKDPTGDVEVWSAYLPYNSSTGNPAAWDDYAKTASEIRL